MAGDTQQEASSILPNVTPTRGPALGRVLYVLVILAIALAFQGSRGLMEPDEGRYANAALEMLESGDWITPRLHGLVYLDKPPAVYWSVAAGLQLLGANAWGARLGHSLALAATALLLSAWAGREWGQRVGALAGAAYVTTLAPALAANALTPDTLLVLWTTATFFAYWRYRRTCSPSECWRWALLLGLFASLGFLTKGTAALVFLAPIGLHALWSLGPRSIARRPELWFAALLATAIGLSWYVTVAANVPGAARYFFDNQIAGRLWDNSYNRNPQWWAPFEVYGSMLLLGTLPWTFGWWHTLLSSDRSARLREVWSDSLSRFLILATVFPTVVFSLAKSRLHLYILPALPCLVMLTVFLLSRRQSRTPWSRWVLLAASLIAVVRLFAASVPLDRDSRELAAALRRAEVPAGDCIDALSTKTHGLTLYGYERVTWHTIWPDTYPYFEPPQTLAQDLSGLLESCGQRVRFLVESKHRPAVEELFGRLQLDCADRSLSGRTVLFDCAPTRSVQEAQLPSRTADAGKS